MALFSRKIMHHEGQKMITIVIKYHDDKNNISHVIVLIENAMKRAVIAANVSERTVCKTGEESRMAETTDSDLVKERR
jgi:hypothetical protein